MVMHWAVNDWEKPPEVRCSAVRAHAGHKATHCSSESIRINKCHLKQPTVGAVALQHKWCG